MLMTVEFLRDFINTDKEDRVLEARLRALEASIRKRTNNNFQNVNIRFFAEARDGILKQSSPYIAEGDTIQISESNFNKGLYVVESKTDYQMTLNKQLFDEGMILITKIEYPEDVVMGAIDMMKWILKNEEENYNPNAERKVHSESISRHQVTYEEDTTEKDIDEEFGVPKKYTAFLKRYMKARF